MKMGWNLGGNEVKMMWKWGENGAECCTRKEQYAAVYSNTKQYKAFLQAADEAEWAREWHANEVKMCWIGVKIW